MSKKDALSTKPLIFPCSKQIFTSKILTSCSSSLVKYVTEARNSCSQLRSWASLKEAEKIGNYFHKHYYLIAENNKIFRSQRLRMYIEIVFTLTWKEFLSVFVLTNESSWIQNPFMPTPKPTACYEGFSQTEQGMKPLSYRT